jgi:plastocyanin
MDPITDDKYATIHITGTAPMENEDYDINLSGIFTGTVTSPINYTLENEAVTFATGIVLSIGEGTDIPDPSEIVCSDPCPAVTDQTMSQTTIPYYAPEALTYSVNEPVNSCITIKCPATTTVEYMGMPIQASISSMTITGFSNLPDGMTYCVSRVDMDPTTNNFATLHLEGTPTATGDFNLDISCNVTGTANVFGNNTDLNNQAVTFPTGIVVTITEQPSNPVVADFTTDPEATQLLGGSVINITVGETITYTNASENATSIAWTFDGGNPTSSTDNTVEVTYATAGDYTTTLTAYGANNEQSTKTVGVKVSEEGESSIDENMASKISVYPNPTSTVINIAAEGMQNITIMDMTGRVVMNKDVNSNFETINAEGFAKANYMVRIATADGVVVKNIVIE